MEQLVTSQTPGKDRISLKMFERRHIQNQGKKFSKQQIVHYDRLKPFLEPHPTSNVPKRNKTRSFQSTQDTTDTHKHTDGTLDHDDCFSFLTAPSSVFTLIHALGRTIASIPSSRIAPITSCAAARQEITRSPPVFSQSSTLEQPSPHTGIDVAMQSQNIPPIDIQPLIPGNAFLQERHSPRDNLTEIVDAAARNHRTPPANTSKMQIRPNTSTERKAQPLLTSFLLYIVTGYNSPDRKTEKQSGT